MASRLHFTHPWFDGKSLTFKVRWVACIVNTYKRYCKSVIEIRCWSRFFRHIDSREELTLLIAITYGLFISEGKTRAVIKDNQYQH